VEGDFVCVRVNAGWIVRSCFMEEDKVNHGYGGDNEWEEEVECEKSAKSSVIYGEAASDSLYQSFAHVGYGREKVCNDGCTSEGHLSSGQHVAYKGGHYYEKEKDNPDISCFFIEVGAVV